jgi:adenylate cyclase, class 2
VQDTGGAGEALMVDATSPNETEIKIRLQSPELVAARLTEAGFAVAKPRVFEANTVYDQAGGEVRARGCLLRLREVADVAILTFKGPAQPGRHKSREELETTMGDARTAASILDRLGFIATFRYEKYRTEYERPGEHGIVTVDETPIGWFLELEGRPEWIDRTATALGYSESDYIIDSYGSLYLRHCTAQSVKPTHMIFSKTPDGH